MQNSVSDRGGCAEVQLQLSQSLKVAFWTEQVEKLVLSVVGYFQGERGKLTSVKEVKIEVIFTSHLQKNILVEAIE